MLHFLQRLPLLLALAYKWLAEKDWPVSVLAWKDPVAPNPLSLTVSHAHTLVHNTNTLIHRLMITVWHNANIIIFAISVMSRDLPTVIGFEVMRMEIGTSGRLIPKTKCRVDKPGKANVGKQHQNILHVQHRVYFSVLTNTCILDICGVPRIVLSPRTVKILLVHSKNHSVTEA